MPTMIHFIDVGQGNMVLIEATDGRKFVFDCNLTDQNADCVLKYMSNQIGYGTQLYAFICSHRDADHMRGVKRLHAHFPIRAVWDSGVSGTTTLSSEYVAYMELRRTLNGRTIDRRTFDDYGRTRLRYFSAKDERLPFNANAQGIVIKVEQRTLQGRTAGSVLLPGYSDAQTWRTAIMKDYSNDDLASSILMAAHHGSISFFDDPADDRNYFTEHLRTIRPAMTVISVGPNVHGHPDQKSVELYEKYSTGSNRGHKVFRTDRQGSMKLSLKDDGSWSLLVNQ